MLPPSSLQLPLLVSNITHRSTGLGIFVQQQILQVASELNLRNEWALPVLGIWLLT